jgi:hypothetical protein
VLYQSAVGEISPRRCALSATVPAGDRDRFPLSVGILSHNAEVRNPLAFEARSPYLTGTTWWGWLVEGGVQAQASDEGNRIGEPSTTSVEELRFKEA